MNFPNPQELFQRFQALQDMMANNPQGAPSPSALHPWMNPSLMAASGIYYSLLKNVPKGALSEKRMTKVQF